MENVLVASCKRLVGRALRKIKNGSKGNAKTILLPDGAHVVVWKLSMLDERAKLQAEKIARLEGAQYTTNMWQDTSLAVKTQSRDYVLETLLRSGEFNFQNLFLIRNPYRESPLCAMILFMTSEKCRVRVTTKGKTWETDYVVVLPEETYHRVPVFGLYPGYENTVLLELLAEDDSVIGNHVVPITTKSLPSGLQKCIDVRKKAQDPAFPFVMINGGVNIHTCAFDKEGDIRFYLKRKPRGYGIFPLSNGHFFYMEKDIATPSFSNPQTVLSHDMDYMGRVFKTYLTKNGVHHTAEEKAGGNILTASNSMLEHTEDMVIEIDRITGEIVWSLAIWDLFDDKYKDMMDWCHVNSAVYYEKDDSVLISLRNIHAVICVDYTTKKLRWLLSDPEFWKGTAMTKYLLKPEGNVTWTYQQHAAYELDVDFDGNPDTKHIMVYDNHWAKRRKAKSFDKAKDSYVAIYTVCEKEKTVKEYKKFAGPKTRIRANSIYVPEKERIYNMAGAYANNRDGNAGGVLEYDFNTGELVSEYGIKPGYFRGYKFEPSYEELIRPMEMNRNYLVGKLKTPKKMSDEAVASLCQKKPVHVKNAAIDYELKEDIVMVKAPDHTLEKIYLQGKKGWYEVEYDDTYQTMDIFSHMVYFHTAWLQNLPDDRYELFLQVKGEYQKTGKYIEKRHL